MSLEGHQVLPGSTFLRVQRLIRVCLSIPPFYDPDLCRARSLMLCDPDLSRKTVLLIHTLSSSSLSPNHALVPSIRFRKIPSDPLLPICCCSFVRPVSLPIVLVPFSLRLCLCLPFLTRYDPCLFCRYQIPSRPVPLSPARTTVAQGVCALGSDSATALTLAGFVSRSFWPCSGHPALGTRLIPNLLRLCQVMCPAVLTCFSCSPF